MRTMTKEAEAEAKSALMQISDEELLKMFAISIKFERWGIDNEFDLDCADLEQAEIERRGLFCAALEQSKIDNDLAGWG